MNTSASGGFDGYEVAPVVASPSGRRFIPRLSLTGTPKLEYDSAEIVRAIETGLRDALFFCDTSLFDDRTDPAIWTSLLQTDRQLVIIPPVHQELEPWLRTHSSHIAARAIAREDPAIWFMSYDEFDDVDRATLSYYVTLIGVRKRLLQVKEIEFERVHNRHPDERERRVLLDEIQQDFGPRGHLLARKGAARPTGPTFLTDEHLVCLAMMIAISTGRETVILTKDEDVQEQFYKLQWLLDTHYRGMLLADLYAVDPFRFVFHSLPENVPDVEDAFEGNNNVLIERSPELLSAILPKSCTPALVYCWIIGERLTHMTVCLETEMRRLWRTKGETGGLNTDRLNGRNCHIWLAPLEIPPSLQQCAAIVNDRRSSLPKSSVTIPLLDVNQAVYCGETFRHFVDDV